MIRRSRLLFVLFLLFLVSPGKAKTLEPYKPNYQEKEMAQDEALRFFKPLLNNFSAKLFIPAPIADHIRKAKSRDKVTLVNHECKMWHVDLHIGNKYMYLGGESWQDFVQANELEIGHFLFFKYKGNMVFTFRIFDPTFCERTLRKKKMAKEVIDVEESTKKEVGYTKKRRGQEAHNTSKAEHATSSNKKNRGEEDLNTSKDNAYFETTITANNLKRNRLYVPASFRDCSGLSMKHTGFSIRDPEGRTWLISIGHRHRCDQFHMSKGWLELSHEHQLKAGDKLRFELVSAKGKDNTMHLNMFKLWK